jgi:hypothetical protein
VYPSSLSKIILARFPDSGSLSIVTSEGHSSSLYASFSEIDIPHKSNNVMVRKAIVIKLNCKINYYYYYIILQELLDRML